MTDEAELDPRRWITLGIVISSILIVVLDNSILNVAIPTILRDFHTTLPSLQWVITGYALTFATLLIIGGRLGDVFGHRRVFMIGATLFGCGSLLASVSWNVPSLVLGEAIIEGIGASLMMPTTLAILATTFQGRERATAFAAWGATAGAAAAFGPVVGGFLTTNYSWRWAFRINVFVAPVAVLGALLVIRPGLRAATRERIDVPGAALVAAGTFLLVFGLSEGGTYGWAEHIGGPALGSASVVPAALAGGIVILTAFYRLERWKEAQRSDPLFQFSQLRYPTFRYGLLTTIALAMGQLGVLFALPVFLQNAKHLTAETNGLWMLPIGLMIIAGAQIGGRLAQRIGITIVVRIGLTLESIGILLLAFRITPPVDFSGLLPGFVIFGTGIGFASSQLTNVVLTEIAADRTGAASGANATVRQLGNALGTAIIGTLLTAQTISHASASLRAVAAMPASVKAAALDRIHALGANASPPPGAAPADADAIRRIVVNGVAAGTRPALVFAGSLVGIGAVLSLLIPRVGTTPPRAATDEVQPPDLAGSLEPVVAPAAATD